MDGEDWKGLEMTILKSLAIFFSKYTNYYVAPLILSHFTYSFLEGYSLMLTMWVLMNPLKKGNTNFLTWTALRSCIINMKSKSSFVLPTLGSLDPMNFEYQAKSFNAYTVKWILICYMVISSKGRIPNGFKELTADFELSDPQEVFSIPYLVASETYVWSFQYGVLNFINCLWTINIFKIGLIDLEKCSLCGINTEDLYHLFFNCSFNCAAFWNIFIVRWFDLSGVCLNYNWLTSKERFIKLFDNFRGIDYLGV